MPGKVILVGAGPGDPGLMTLKGRAALEQADVVVYDRLVSPAVLEMIPEGKRRIDVGKEASRHPVPQERINAILLEEARAGHTVVRLKGGDPFLFGRGGEELEALEGIEFEEVPGITSAIAAAAYAGIPVTHRDYSSSLHILTGHARAGGTLDLDFQALVRLKGTLVFLMGVGALPEIVRGLLTAGMDASTPAAVVENGALPAQRCCRAALADLPGRAAEMALHSPAVIIVGQVCALELDWFSKLPLCGKRILVTRPKDRAGPLSGQLRALGAEVVERPCVRTEPISPCPAMEAALRDLASYEWLAFTSAAGVEAFWNCLREELWQDARALGGVKLAVNGPAAFDALVSHGLHPDLIPGDHDAAHLGGWLAQVAEGKILLLRAEEPSPALTDALSAAGKKFDSIPVYRTVYDNPPSTALRTELEAERFDYVTFTSASTVKGFVSAVGADAPFNRTLGLCIGEQTAAEARRWGIPVQVAARPASDALVELALRVGLCPNPAGALPLHPTAL